MVGQDIFQAYRELIPEVDRFNESLSRPMARFLRVNTLRIDPWKLTEMLGKRGHRVKPSPLSDDFLETVDPAGLRNTLEAALGYFLFQALTSAVAVTALDPRPDEFVCDLCAAPGVKTTHMGQLMKNTGLIIANDSKERRLRVLEHNVRRLGVTNVITTRYAGQNFPRRWRFDRVLADVPCSGEGTIRYAPGSDQRPVREKKHHLIRAQQGLIVQAFDLLTAGGVLLYATCTYDPDENEAVVQHLLERRPAEILPIEVPLPHAPGACQWRDKTYDRQMERCWRIYPHHINSVGFFLAKIRRQDTKD